MGENEQIDTRTEYQKRREFISFKSSECKVEFGHCAIAGGEGKPFGRPSPTPHVCGATKRHVGKLHTCGICGGIGANHKPLKGTRVYREYQNVLRLKAEEQAKRFRNPEFVADMDALKELA